MSEYKSKYADMFIEPELDFSNLSRSITEEDCDLAMSKIVHRSGDDHRRFVEYIRQHPEALISWDNQHMSFAEYARRVDAGEFD